MISDAVLTTRASDGTRLAWREQGAGQPVLLIMGLGADASKWERHVECLSSRFRCLLTDNRGVGRSGAPNGPYTTAMMADDHAAVLGAAGVEAASVVGISMGGAIAQQLAVRHPQLVRRLVLVSSWATCGAFTRDTLDELKSLRHKLTPAEFTRRLQLLIWSPSAYAERAPELRRDRDAESAFDMSQEAFAAQCDACMSHDTAGDLGSLSVPTLITAGEYDAFTPLSCSEELADLIPTAHLEVFAAGGHAHHWEQLDRFNRLCEEFLDVE